MRKLLVVLLLLVAVRAEASREGIETLARLVAAWQGGSHGDSVVFQEMDLDGDGKRERVALLDSDVLIENDAGTIWWLADAALGEPPSRKPGWSISKERTLNLHRYWPRAHFSESAKLAIRDGRLTQLESFDGQERSKEHHDAELSEQNPLYRTRRFDTETWPLLLGTCKKCVVEGRLELGAVDQALELAFLVGPKGAEVSLTLPPSATLTGGVMTGGVVKLAPGMARLEVALPGDTTRFEVPTDEPWKMRSNLRRAVKIVSATSTSVTLRAPGKVFAYVLPKDDYSGRCDLRTFGGGVIAQACKDGLPWVWDNKLPPPSERARFHALADLVAATRGSTVGTFTDQAKWFVAPMCDGDRLLWLFQHDGKQRWLLWVSGPLAKQECPAAPSTPAWGFNFPMLASPTNVVGGQQVDISDVKGEPSMFHRLTITSVENGKIMAATDGPCVPAACRAAGFDIVRTPFNANPLAALTGTCPTCTLAGTVDLGPLPPGIELPLRVADLPATVTFTVAGGAGGVDDSGHSIASPATLARGPHRLRVPRPGGVSLPIPTDDAVRTAGLLGAGAALAGVSVDGKTLTVSAPAGTHERPAPSAKDCFTAIEQASETRGFIAGTCVAGQPRLWFAP